MKKIVTTAVFLLSLCSILYIQPATAAPTRIAPQDIVVGCGKGPYPLSMPGLKRPQGDDAPFIFRIKAPAGRQLQFTEGPTWTYPVAAAGAPAWGGWTGQNTDTLQWSAPPTGGASGNFTVRVTGKAKCVAGPGGGGLGAGEENEFSFDAQWTGDVCPQLDKLQYFDGVNYVDVADTLYVLKGTTVTFKVKTNPVDAPVIADNLQWGGDAGATGSGVTKAVLFGTPSTTLTALKTVTASCDNGAEVRANVVVCEWDPASQAKDTFPGRSEMRYGVGEVVDLLPRITPVGAGLTVEWSKVAGPVTLPANSSTFTAQDVAGTATFKVTVTAGPSKGQSVNIGREIVAPTSIAMSNYYGMGAAERVGHNVNSMSVGARTRVSILPTDVSFKNIQVAELGAEATGTGAFAPYTNSEEARHERTVGYVGVLKPTNNTDGSLFDGGDRIGYGTADTVLAPGVDPAGTLTWNIPYAYVVPGTPVVFERRLGGNDYTVAQVFTVTTAGRVTVSKGGYTIAANYGAPTVYPELTLPQLGEEN